MSQIDPYDRDDDLIAATRSDGQGRARAYPFGSCAVVVGRGSRAEVEVDLEACAADGVPVLRRHGGGCAVLLDPGNVIVSVTQPVNGPLGSRGHFERISDWLIDGLAAAGVAGVYREGTSDLALGDRKIAGACIYRSRGLLYYSASLLVDPDIEGVERYLRHPPREPAYRRGRSHRDFMGSLAAYLGADSVPGFAQRLGERLASNPVETEKPGPVSTFAHSS